MGEGKGENLCVLFEDASLIFVLKPAGVSAQSPGMPERIEAYLGDGTRVHVLHRLDRDVSGVMVYAKTKEATATASAMIARGEMQKEYLAEVHGTPPPRGELRDLLYHDAKRNKTFVVTRLRRGVREAILTYETVRAAASSALVHVRLVTGRTHQIRVQFASRGYPLVGDGKYGGGGGKIRLFSHRITLIHPISGEEITVSAEPLWAHVAE